MPPPLGQNTASASYMGWIGLTSVVNGIYLQCLVIGVLYNLLSSVLNLDTVIDHPGRVFPTTAVRFPESGRLVYSLLCKVNA